MSCNRFVEAWGSAEGAAKSLSPSGRLVAGGLLFSSVLTCDPATIPGAGITVGILIAWFFAVRPPRLLLGPLLLFALFLFAPFFVLIPWIPTTESSVELLIPMPWAVPWRIAIKGTVSLLVSAWTASTLAMYELESALVRLRVPRPLAELLLQMIHQTHALAEETRTIAQATRVRGALLGWRWMTALAASLPQVWLPRVLYRADRIGDAMELRGFELESRSDDLAPNRRRDWLVMGGAFAVFLLAVLVRFF